MPQRTPQQLGPTRSTAATGILILVMGLISLGWNLAAEPEFVDEWAFVSQSYYGDFLFHRDDPVWLDYPAYDLPPLPKYLTAAALAASGHERPGPRAMRQWYADTSSRFGDHDLLVAARWPTVAMGALACVAVFALGSLAVDQRVGLLGAVVLLSNPLFRMHARRAMADVPAEALALASCVLALWAWTRWCRAQGFQRAWTWAGLGTAGLLAGAAVLAKLNGGLAIMVLCAWTLFMAFAGPCVPLRRLEFALAALVSCVLAYGLFVALNPFLTCQPARRLPPPSESLAEMSLLQRTAHLIRHRAGVSREGQDLFPADATRTLAAKGAVLAVQGFGRFGPLGRHVLLVDALRHDPERQRFGFDSTRRFDWRQDAGALVWGPVVLAGAVRLISLGKRQRRAGRPPAAWALGIQWLVTMATVGLFLPLAWDRYLLPAQAISGLLAATAVIGLWDALGRRGQVPVGTGAPEQEALS